MVYGSRSERFVPDQSPAVQLSLLPLPEPAPAASPAQSPVQISYPRKEKKDNVQPVHPGRMTFPASLPRLREVIEPEGLTQGHRKIGEEVTQELEYWNCKLLLH